MLLSEHSTMALLITDSINAWKYELEYINTEKHNAIFYLFKVVNSEPYFTLRVEYAAQITPSHGKARLCLNGLQIARLYQRRPIREEHQSAAGTNQTAASSKTRLTTQHATHVTMTQSVTCLRHRLARLRPRFVHITTVKVIRQPRWWRPVFPMPKPFCYHRK